jgi:hypothetical protein
VKRTGVLDRPGRVLRRAFRLMVAPAAEWAAIAVEVPDARRLLLGYVLPLSPLPAFAWMTGLALFQSGYLYVLGLQALGLARPQQATEFVAVALLLVTIASGLAGAVLAALHIL